MGSIGDCFDNALAESFFSSLQVELLDRQSWATRQQLANAIFSGSRPGTTRPGAIRPGLPLTHRLRTSPHPHRHRGVTTTPRVSVEPGEGQLAVRHPDGSSYRAPPSCARIRRVDRLWVVWLVAAAESSVALPVMR
jgi:hypothetical protein